MHTNRIKIFHRANCDNVTLSVTNYLELDFFPTADALFNQNLCNRRKAKTILGDVTQHFFVVCNTATSSAQCECRTYNYRITNHFCKCNCIINGFNHLRRNAGLVDLFHGILERLTIFCLVNGQRICAQQLYAVFFQKSLCSKLHGQSQSSLSAHCREQAVRLFNLNDFLDNVQCQRFDVHLICHCLIRHDGSRIGIDQNDFQALLFQCTTCLCTCIVKLRCLSNDNRTRANY